MNLRPLCPGLSKTILSDDEWELLKPLILIHQRVGHPQKVELREIVNAILLRF